VGRRTTNLVVSLSGWAVLAGRDFPSGVKTAPPPGQFKGTAVSFVDCYASRRLTQATCEKPRSYESTSSIAFSRITPR
jgi:hypothetical protein